MMERRRDSVMLLTAGVLMWLAVAAAIPQTPSSSSPLTTSSSPALLPPTEAPQPLCADLPALLLPPGAAGQALSDSQRAFSVHLIKHLAAKTTGNLFVSPHSIYQALLLAYFTAAGHTEESVKRALQLPADMDKLSTMRAYRVDGRVQYWRSQNTTSYELRTANRLFVDKSQPIRDCLKGLFYDDELQVMDFASNPGKARQIINSWVESMTKGHIHDLIPDDGVHEDTKLILANAAYFKGLWQSQFPVENTKKEVFHTAPDNVTLVFMMRQKGSFNFKVSEELRAHVLELPYKGHDVSMFILLPPWVEKEGTPANDGQPKGVDGILAALTPEALTDLVDDQLMARQVEVGIPTFKVEQSADLVETLEALGVGDLFQPSANLTSLTGQPGITFDRIMHKAKIEVDEHGTKAAGATAIFSFRSSRPLTPVQFNCNHPFVYLLYDKGLKTVLFAGVYRTPKI